MVEWLIQIVLQLEVITNNVNVRRAMQRPLEGQVLKV